MKSIVDIIKTIDTENPGINPTVIYNEGWMTRFTNQYKKKSS